MTPPIGATKKASPLDYKSLVLGLNPASDPNLILQVVKWDRVISGLSKVDDSSKLVESISP